MRGSYHKPSHDSWKTTTAVIDFLCTYGWAIIVILVVVFALWYYGILLPRSYYP